MWATAFSMVRQGMSHPRRSPQYPAASVALTTSPDEARQHIGSVHTAFDPSRYSGSQWMSDKCNTFSVGEPSFTPGVIQFFKILNKTWKRQILIMKQYRWQSRFSDGWFRNRTGCNWPFEQPRIRKSTIFGLQQHAANISFYQSQRVDVPDSWLSVKHYFSAIS